MPIRPENRARYPKDWPAIRERIRARSGDRCECTGECGDHIGVRCNCENGYHGWRFEGEFTPWDKITSAQHRAIERGIGKHVKIVLTVAHRDHVPEHCEEENLFHACQRCHLRYDKDHHAETRERTRAARNPDLFETET